MLIYREITDIVWDEKSNFVCLSCGCNFDFNIDGCPDCGKQNIYNVKKEVKEEL